MVTLELREDRNADLDDALVIAVVVRVIVNGVVDRETVDGEAVGGEAIEGEVVDDVVMLEIFLIHGLLSVQGRGVSRRILWFFEDGCGNRTAETPLEWAFK
jgi:hypothetical protein